MQGMTTFTADRVKHAIHAERFYRHELPSAKLGRNAWAKAGLCPFHDDHREGSFFVNLQTGAYRCFACGTKGGDIIDFTCERYALGFVEALRKLSWDWGI